MRENQKIGISRNLRQTLTPAEQVLWNELRNGKLNGRKFRRQQTIGPYIVDFCCMELRLVIELDGDVHAFQEEHDKVRSTYLEREGYRIIRFPNSEITENLSGVMEMLWDMTKPNADVPSP